MLWDRSTFVDSIDRALVGQTDRDALGEEIVARLLPYVKHRFEDTGSGMGYSSVVRR